MASDLNRCDFIGRLGKDPEVINMKNGDPMTIFSIAVNESWTSRNGEKVKKVEWVNLVAYKKLAEICAKYLVKGSHVYVSGKFNTNKYQGKDGAEKIGIQIILDSMQMLGAKFHQDGSIATDEVLTEQEIDKRSKESEPFGFDEIPF